MSICNAAALFLLARTFDTNQFSQYLVTMSAVSSLSIVAGGLQSNIAHAYSLRSRKIVQLDTKTFRSGEKLAFKLSWQTSLIWVILAPLLSYIADLELSVLMAATALPLVMTFGSLTSGRLQGSGRLFQWRTLLSSATLLQIPIVLGATLLALNLEVLIALMALPTVFFYVAARWLIPEARDPSFESAIEFRKLPVFVLLVGTVGNQVPMLFIRQSLDNQSIGSLSLFIYALTFASSLSGTFGSLIMPKFVRSSSRRFDLGEFYVHAVHASLVPAISIGYLTVGPIVLKEILGNNFAKSPTASVSLAALVAFYSWGIVISIVAQRISRLQIQNLMLFGATIGIEIVLIVLLKPGLTPVLAIHSISGLTAIFFLLYRPRDSQEILPN